MRVTNLHDSELQPLLDAFSGEVALAYYDFRRSEHLFLDADRVLPSASLIKLPILATALQRRHAQELDLARRVPVFKKHMVPGNGVLKLLQRGLRPTVRDLLTLMIVISDNTAANRIIDLVGIDAVNAFCREAGLERTALVGKLQAPPHERTAAQREGRRNETSAADMLGLLLQLERGDLLPPPETAIAKEILFGQIHTEAIGRYLPLDPEAHDPVVRLASKNGCLPGIWHDAGIVYDDRAAPLFALVVMTAGSEDRAEHGEQEGMMLIANIARVLFRSHRTP